MIKESDFSNVWPDNDGCKTISCNESQKEEILEALKFKEKWSSLPTEALGMITAFNWLKENTISEFPKLKKLQSNLKTRIKELQAEFDNCDVEKNPITKGYLDGIIKEFQKLESST